MKFLAESTQTLISTLMQKLEDSRFDALDGVGFVSKRQGSKTYWYCQYTDISGVRKQRFVGPDDAKTRAIVDAAKNSVAQESIADRKRLVAMITAGGGQPEKGRPAKIIEKLAGAGVFDSGGMLIGSYAFSCYGNMLGVVFDDTIRRTEDMDVAYDRSIEIGYIRDVRLDILEASSEMVEPKQINPWVPPYELRAPDGFKIEFLTSRTGPHDKAPVPIEAFKVNAQPLEFLDYLLGSAVKGVVVYGAGILVTVPDPGRYAVHKLAISQLRPFSNPEKSRKDIAQATALIEYLIEEAPGCLLVAFDELQKRDDALKSFVIHGLAMIDDDKMRSVIEDNYLHPPKSSLKI